NEEGEKLQRLGNEVGATTGRPRRCGWLDIPQLNHSIMINGVTQLVITKVDVLSGFDQFKVAENYRIDGTITDKLPFDLLAQEIEIDCKILECWHEDIGEIKDFEQLPKNAQNYIQYIEETTGVPIAIVSNGPGRTQLIQNMTEVR